jgi:hypothetical protein
MYRHYMPPCLPLLPFSDTNQNLSISVGHNESEYRYEGSAKWQGKSAA